MVAYGFKRQFVAFIESGHKCQTVRAHRAGRSRHALPGEHVQLYEGMRTKACRKLIPDPLCIGVDEIRIQVGQLRPYSTGAIEINDVPLSETEAEQFVREDGFTNLVHFRVFWKVTHGLGLFTGVVIRWEAGP